MFFCFNNFMLQLLRGMNIQRYTKSWQYLCVTWLHNFTQDMLFGPASPLQNYIYKSVSRYGGRVRFATYMHCVFLFLKQQMLRSVLDPRLHLEYEVSCGVGGNGGCGGGDGKWATGQATWPHLKMEAAHWTIVCIGHLGCTLKDTSTQTPCSCTFHVKCTSLHCHI